MPLFEAYYLGARAVAQLMHARLAKPVYARAQLATQNKATL